MLLYVCLDAILPSHSSNGDPRIALQLLCALCGCSSISQPPLRCDLYTLGDTRTTRCSAYMLHCAATLTVKSSALRTVGCFGCVVSGTFLETRIQLAVQLICLHCAATLTAISSASWLLWLPGELYTLGDTRTPRCSAYMCSLRCHSYS